MELRDAVERIVAALGEHDEQACEQIVGVVGALGEPAALELLEETLATEHAGGMLLADGSRRRTPGGVFFHLARRSLPAEQRKRIFKTAPTATDASAAIARVDRGSADDRWSDEDVSSDAPVELPTRRRRIVAPTWQQGLAAGGTADAAAEVQTEARTTKQPHRRRRQTRPSQTITPEFTEPPHSHIIDDLPAGTDSLEVAVFELAHRFALSMVPLLREAMIGAARDALLSGTRPLRAFDQSAGDDDLHDERAEQTEIRPRRAKRQARHRAASEPRGSVRKRVLGLLEARPGMTVGELAMELYGEDDRRTRDRVKAVTYRLREAGTIRGGGAEGFALDGGEASKSATLTKGGGRVIGRRGSTRSS